MQIGYGVYRHPTYEASLVSFVSRPNLTPRGFKKSTIVTAHVQGDIVLAAGEDQYDLTSKIQDLSDAYALDGYDWGLYHDDNSPTPHFLENDTSLSGTRIIYKSFPSANGGEYASGREFAYAVQAEYLTPESIILDYRETITHKGTTGPRRVWKQRPRQAPYYEYTHPSSTQLIIQEGYAVTLLTYLDPPDPLAGAPYEDLTQRMIQRIGPTRHPNGFEGYTVKWRYVFESNTIIPAFPSTT